MHPETQKRDIIAPDLVALIGGEGRHYGVALLGKRSGKMFFEQSDDVLLAEGPALVTTHPIDQPVTEEVKRRTLRQRDLVVGERLIVWHVAVGALVS